MRTESSVLARAVSDGHDRLVSAEEPLAGLHLRCGGELPGTIAVPALLELVRKARHYNLKLARTIVAQDGFEAITAWVEVTPQPAGSDDGCQITLGSWNATPLSSEDMAVAGERRIAINRQLAELSARLDADQRILAVSATAPDLEQASRQMADGIGKPWTEFVTIEGGQHHQPMHWRLLDGARVTLPGSQRRWQATLVPHGQGGSIDGFELCLAAETPIPESGPVQAELAPSPKEARTTLAAEVAPTLRVPLERIISNAQAIRSRLAGPLDPTYAHYADDIAAAGEHLLSLLDDLSELNEVEATDLSVSREKFDLAEIARRAAAMLAAPAQERRTRIDPPDLDETLLAYGDPRRALQILLNLTSNAVRYGPEESQVWLLSDEENGRARIIVADLGQGLSEDQQAKLFNKFERLGRNGDGGSGLGLYISRRLAEAMGGSITIDSAPGQGARFILELPSAA